MKIALLQGRYPTGRIYENARLLIQRTLAAAADGAVLCVAPELALCGADPRDLLLDKSFIAQCSALLHEMAKELAAYQKQEGDERGAARAALLLGAPIPNPTPVGQPVHNCAVLLFDGKVRIVSREVVLSYQIGPSKQHYFEKGVQSETFDFSGWRFAVLMATDRVESPLLGIGSTGQSQRSLLKSTTGKVDAIIFLSSIFYSPEASATQEKFLAAAAASYRVPVIQVNHAGGCGYRVFMGETQAYRPDGSLFARSGDLQEETLFINIATYEGRVEKKSSELSRVWNSLVVALKDYAHDAGKDTAIIGLSGGIDSSLVAALATEAFGPKKVTGVLMPSMYTSKESRNDALKLAHNLHISVKEIPIHALVNTYLESLAENFSGYPADVTEENIQSRIRGNILMALSNKFNALVICTGNKSEAAMGYFTLYGDAIGALALIGDIYKTQVYELANFFNRKNRHFLIPKNIFVKAPSAELKPNQKDSDNLPPYEQLDSVLKKLIEHNMSLDEIIATGFSPVLVSQVGKAVFGSDYKRRQMPPAICVSDRPFGGGWNMPVNFVPRIFER